MTDEHFMDVCNRSISMSAAAAELKLNIKTLRSRAKRLGCYRPNQGGAGMKKRIEPKHDLEDILAGNNPSYQTNHLRKRLLKSGYLDNCCDVCGLREWNGKPIVCELDHINGIRSDHRLENIRLLCPNCHSQTSNFRGKNKKNRQTGEE